MTTSLGIVGLASFYGPDYARRAAGRADVDVGGAVALAADDDLRALGRPTREEFAEEHGRPVDGSIDALADRGIDAAVVASPTDRRADDAVALLKSGIPVLTAKPAADGPEGARRIADAARDGPPALTTCPARFDDAIGALAERTAAGDVGDVVSVRASIRHDRVPAAGIDANAEHAPDQAGSIYAMGYYTADALLWLASGSPERAHAEFETVDTPHSAHPDLGCATLAFDDGTLGSMTMTYSTDCRERLGNWEVEVVGTDGIARTSHTGYEGIVWRAGPPDERSAEAFARTPSPILDRQLSAFLDAVETGEYPHPVPEPESVAQALAVCAAWERSDRTGTPVELRSDEGT